MADKEDFQEIIAHLPLTIEDSPDDAPKVPPVASPEQMRDMHRLASRVGPDAVEEVTRLTATFPQGVPLSVYRVVMGRFRERRVL